MKPLTIAIDGPAGAGKSTIAKQVASHFGYTYLNTGAMYRCVALQAQREKLSFDDEQAVESCLDDIHIDLKPDGRVFLNGEDVSAAIRANDISAGASAVASYRKVRDFLVARQRAMAKSGGVVLEGRDIGTVVMPQADLKIFQTASLEARAMRRYKENIARGLKDDYEAIYEALKKRDEEDSRRALSPLKKADDAITIDTSDMTIAEVAQEVIRLAEEVLSCR